MQPGELTILGGGPAGLAAAFYAHRQGVSCALYERGEPGGLCRTFRCGEHAYDSGAHRFHDRDREVTADVRQLLGDAIGRVHSRSTIFDEGRCIDFPPTPLNLLRTRGARHMARACFEIVAARLSRRHERSFEDFAVRRFGRSLARRYLLDYSEKVWGHPAAELSPDIATSRLSGMSLRTLCLELVAPSRVTSHIDGEFLYPRDGYGSIAAALVAALPGDAIATGREVVGLRCVDRRVQQIEFASGECVAPADRVLSTLPLTVLVKLLGGALPPHIVEAARTLRFRTVRLLFLRLARAHVSDAATLYFPDRAMCVTRAHEPKNRSLRMAPSHETSLVAEVPCFVGDDVHALADHAIAARVTGELAATGLIAATDVVEWRHHWLHAAYPVYRIGYAETLRQVLDALRAIDNLDTLGRGARFIYSHLHDQLRWAKDYAAALRAR